MQYVELGKSGRKVSVITHGCMELGGGFGGLHWEAADKKENIRLLHMALDQGINLFDTAEVYGDGNSEKIVGEAMRDRRSRCLIATKVSPEHLGKSEVRTAVENSLRRLETDYIDLLYIHWPNADIELGDTLGVFEQMKREGNIGGIGISNFSLMQLREAILIAPIDAFQMEYNLLEWKGKEELLICCQEKNITVFTYNSMAKGILSGVFHSKKAKLPPNDFRSKKLLFKEENLKAERELIFILEEVAKEHSASLPQISLAWILSDRRIGSAIVGTQKLAHFLENLETVRLKLSQEQVDLLTKTSEAVIGKMKRQGESPCKRV